MSSTSCIYDIYVYVYYYCVDFIGEITSIFHSKWFNCNQTLSCVTIGGAWYTLYAKHCLHFSEIRWFINAHFLVCIIDFGRFRLRSNAQIVWSLVAELENLRTVTYSSYVHDANKPLLFLSLYHVDQSPFLRSSMTSLDMSQFFYRKLLRLLSGCIVHQALPRFLPFLCIHN